MEKLLVSIIVPVYGVEKYLDACVQSIVSQTYRELEIFLIDDGSPDRCGEMCDAWAKKDNRIKVIHKENGGQGTARNAALDVCSGDYILFIDSDDAVELDMVEKLLNPLQNGTYDLIMCGFKTDNGIRIQNADWYADNFTLDNQELIKRYLSDKMIRTAPWCKMFHRRIFDEIRFPDFRANEDAYIMHRLLGECEKSAVICEALYSFNVRSDSTEGKKFDPNKQHLLDCACDLRDYIIENYPMYSHLVRVRVINETMYLINRMYADRVQKHYPEIEDKLAMILAEERKPLNQQCVTNYDSIVDLYLDHRSSYVRKMWYQGVKKELKRNLKRILSRLKHKICGRR